MNATVMTRSQFEQNLKSRYRQATLELLTPRWKYVVLGFAFAVIQLTILVMVRQPVVALAISFFAFAGCVWLAWQYGAYDREVRARASLTPIYDLTPFRGQVHVLGSAVGLLRSATDALLDGQMARTSLADATQAVATALQPILRRGPTTIENARAEGYPAYPGVKTGWGKDLVSPHVARIEEAYMRLQAISAADGVIAETASQVAGEFIPPLRAIEAQLNAVSQK